jgi:hypothetical protein
MDYIVNVYLDKNAKLVGGGGPKGQAKLAAHLWFKNTGAPPAGIGWVPVADPVTLSQAQDTVGFTLADAYGELSATAQYKILFGNKSPLAQAVTDQLASGSYAWSPGSGPVVGLPSGSKFVTTSGLSLANRGNFDFSVEVDDAGHDVYYLDPKMIVGP